MVLPHRQQTLFRFPKGPTAHGGSLAQGKRKAARPYSAREVFHVVLRAEQARGRYSLLVPSNAKMFLRLSKKYGKQFDVKCYQYALVGNHAHLVLKPKTKVGFQNFLRVFAGQIALAVTRAKKGKPLAKRFWDLVAFSRIVPWGRAYRKLQHYLDKNILQGARIIRCSRLLVDSG